MELQNYGPIAQAQHQQAEKNNSGIPMLQLLLGLLAGAGITYALMKSLEQKRMKEINQYQSTTLYQNH